MSTARREAVVAVARRHDLPVIEDAAYALYPHVALPALSALAPERVYHIATTAKALSPGLRLAYIVLPTGIAPAAVVTPLRATSLMASPLLVSLVTGWIRDGTANAILAGIRAEAVARQTLAARILPRELMDCHPEGIHIWLTLPARWPRQPFVNYVLTQGLALVPSDAFIATPGNEVPNAVRVALGVAADHGRLAQALHALASALNTTPPNGFQDIV
jgi:DNA-binding transcriptional MocR family regulator